MSRSSEIFPISDMLKIEPNTEKSKGKRQGFVSVVCFLAAFFAAFLLIWNANRLLDEQYLEKQLELGALENLAVHDLRADIYSFINASTLTIASFSDEVIINGRGLYLDDNGEIFIQRGE